MNYANTIPREVVYNILGQPVTTPDYYIAGVSPDIAMSLLREPQSIEARLFNDFLTKAKP